VSAAAAPDRAVRTPAGPLDVPDTLHLVEPLPGLPSGTRYTLDALDEIGFLFALHGADGVRLFVISPGLVFPDYRPAIPREALDAVCGAERDPDVVLLAVVHPGPGERLAPTADLLAPIVVDRATGRALQVVLDEDLPLRAPLR
jgi:flagellar assembly factor FliW